MKFLYALALTGCLCATPASAQGEDVLTSTADFVQLKIKEQMEPYVIFHRTAGACLNDHRSSFSLKEQSNWDKLAVWSRDKSIEAAETILTQTPDDLKTTAQAFMMGYGAGAWAFQEKVTELECREFYADTVGQLEENIRQ